LLFRPFGKQVDQNRRLETVHQVVEEQLENPKHELALDFAHPKSVNVRKNIIDFSS